MTYEKNDNIDAKCEEISPEGPFLTVLFQRLNRQRIDYCVLRNYKKLPTSHDGSDIDILFSPACFKKAHQIIMQASLDYGGRCISEIRAHRVISRSFCGRYKEKRWGVRFDTFTYVGTNGCDILPLAHVLNRTFLYRGIRVANAADADITAFIKEIIGAGQTRKDYRQLAVKAFAEEKKLFTTALQSHFGPKAFGQTMLPMLLNKNLSLRTASSALKSGRMRTEPAKTLVGHLIDHYHRLKRLFNRPGACIAVQGTDGSGKSTVIDGVKPALEDALHCPIFYRHMRPNLLPSIARLFRRPAPKDTVTNPHASRPSGFLGSLLRLCYYSLDYTLGYWLTIWPSMVKKPCLYIFDRYYYDYLIDPRRARIELPGWLLRLFLFFIPRPDLTLCLGADPHVIRSRKPELPLNEVQRQISELKTFCQKAKDTVWIDTGTTINNSVDNSLEAITRKMSRQWSAF